MIAIQKIVVVSMPRTGSTLICELLAQHPDILGFGEIFIETEDGRKFFHEKGTGESCRSYPGPEKLPEYLNYLEAIAHLEGKTKLAFKLMDYQEPRLWELIMADTSIAVISARRWNALECLASAKAGEKSGIWHGHTDEDLIKAAEVTVEVAIEELREWNNRRLSLDARIFGLRNRSMVIEHESLPWRRMLTDELFDFIPIRRVPTRATQRKLNVRPIEERVTNYHELRRLAKSTELEKYFT